MTLPESASSGDRLATLRDLRDVLAATIHGCTSTRDLAALSLRLQSVLEEIAELEAEHVVEDEIDSIVQRRAARGARGASPGVGHAKVPQGLCRVSLRVLDESTY